MKLKTLKILHFSALIILFTACHPGETEVTICGTLHGYHKVNPNYTYDTLFHFIEHYNPDIIGIEVRPEDMNSNVSGEYYPYEMTEVFNRNKDREVYGIDWWNAGIEGMAMSDSIIEHLPNIVWQKAYSSDTAFLNNKPAILDELYNHKLNIAKTASIKEVVTGSYDSLTLAYYHELGQFLKGSPHEKLFHSYMKRHEKIAINIASVVKANPGKKLLFLVGADHQVYARRKLEKIFQDRIHLNSYFSSTLTH